MKKKFIILSMIVTFMSLISICNVKALTLSSGDVLPDSPFEKYVILNNSSRGYIIVNVPTSVYFSNGTLFSIYDTSAQNTMIMYQLNGSSWENTNLGITSVNGTFIASNVDVYTDKNKSSILYTANTGLVINPVYNGYEISSLPNNTYKNNFFIFSYPNDPKFSSKIFCYVFSKNSIVSMHSNSYESPYGVIYFNTDFDYYILDTSSTSPSWSFQYHCYANNAGYFMHELTSSNPPFILKSGVNMSGVLNYSSGFSYVPQPQFNDVTYHYMDYYNSTFNYGSELLSDLPFDSDFNCINFKNLPKNFVNTIGYSYSSDKSDINSDITSYKVNSHSDVYLWFIPRFDMSLYQSYANDSKTGQDIVYNKLSFINYFNDLSFTDFYVLVTDINSNSSIKYSFIDDYIEFNSFYNTSYNVKVYDKNNSLIYSDNIVVNDSHLVSLSDYDSYTFAPGYQYAFISYLPNNGSIYLFNSSNLFSLGAFSLDSKIIDSSLTIPYTDENNKITYSYDFTNFPHYIICLQREFTTDYDTFYVPKGAYVSFTSDSFDENKNYNVPYDYKDESGNVNSDTSQTVVISDDDKNSNNFFDNLSFYFKSFVGVFTFIGNFLTTFLNSLPVEITYALCFAFGFVVITICVKLWL